MHTAVRIDAGKVQGNDLNAVFSRLALLAPGMRFEPGVRAPSLYSATLYEGDDWDDHRSAMLSFLNQCSQIITIARNQGAEIYFDLAVWPRDYRENLTCLLLDHQWLSGLANGNVELEISIYNP